MWRLFLSQWVTRDTLPLVQGRRIGYSDCLSDYERSERARMKAITVMQPYAELIISGEKLVENRTWATAYRGPLLIHAGKSEEWLSTYDPLPDHMEFGAIIGVCMLVDCVRERDIHHPYPRSDLAYLRNHPHVEGPYCWILREARRFQKQILFRGYQKLWEVFLDRQQPSEYLVAKELRLAGWI
jgi:hypothetical protein